MPTPDTNPNDGLFRLASLIGCEPEDEERHRQQLLDWLKAHDQAKASSLRTVIKELPGASGTGYISVTKVLDLLKDEP
jgi:hypothetical protein